VPNGLVMEKTRLRFSKSRFIVNLLVSLAQLYEKLFLGARDLAI
jgi:hypothetical protein